MSNQKLAKLRRQPDSTWALLHKRLISLPDPSRSIFPEDVWEFIQTKADSLSTSTGFLVPCLLNNCIRRWYAQFQYHSKWVQQDASKPLYHIRWATCNW